MDPETEELLKEIYFTPGNPGSFSSSSILKTILEKKYNKKLPLKPIQNWLEGQRSYFLHKPARQNFPRNPTFVTEKDEQWQADLLFLPDLSIFNDGVKIFLAVIDVLSRYAWVVPMNDKSGPETLSAFKKVLEISHPRKPKKLHTDDGTEFFNGQFSSYMMTQNIHHFSTNSDMKAAIAERFIKTIKEKIYKYLSATPTNNRYIDHLSDLVSGYNHTFHSSIGMAPAQVRRCNTGKVLWNLYHHLWMKDRGDTAEKFHEGDFVRISSRRGTMMKRYKGVWTEEIFKISKIKHSVPEKVYKLVDLKNEPIKGSFYSVELQKSPSPNDTDLWQIEEILDERNVHKTGRRGKKVTHKEYLVKWYGYPDSFNQWVHEKDLNANGGNNMNQS